MAIGQCRANYGLSADVTHDGVNVTGNIVVGVAQTALPLTGVNVQYSLKFELAAGAVATWNPATGAVTGATAGVAQIETATGAGTVTVAGNAAVTITGAGFTTLVLAVPVSTGAPSVWMAEIRAYLQNNAAAATVRALWDFTGATTAVIATANTNRDDDGTFNIAIATGTATGITAAPSSVDTTAGVPYCLAYRIDGQAYDTKDFQGVALPNIVTLKGYLVVHESGITDVTADSESQGRLAGVEIMPRFNDAGLDGPWLTDGFEFTCAANSVFTTTALGAS